MAMWGEPRRRQAVVAARVACVVVTIAVVTLWPVLHFRQPDIVIGVPTGANEPAPGPTVIVAPTTTAPAPRTKAPAAGAVRPYSPGTPFVGGGGQGRSGGTTEPRAVPG